MKTLSPPVSHAAPVPPSSPGPLAARFRRWIETTALKLDLGSFEVCLPGAEPLLLGGGRPAFTIECHDRAAMAAILSQNEGAIAEAYIHGSLDLRGDMVELYKLRNALSDRHWLSYLWGVHLLPLFSGQVKCDKRWIAHHYDLDSDFFLLFLDTQTRAYSQAVFAADDEPLEQAMERKLEFACRACRLKPRDRVLDIGGGWGAFTEYAGSRGIHVTSLTISQESESFLNQLVKKQGLEAVIRREHFFDHQPEQKYDAIVNLGVTEHLPDYRKTLRHYAGLLKPGGRVYLDASACRQKYHFSSFISRHIYPGNATPMCFRDYVAKVERSPFEIISIHNDRRNYELTARRWAENLDAARDEITRRWGEPLYRKYRLYLWGTAHAFASNLMSAYRLVLELPAATGDLSRWDLGK